MACTTSYKPVQFPINVIFFLYSMIPATIALFGNFIVVFAVCKKKILHTSSNILLTGLALSDFLLTASCQVPFAFYFSFNASPYNCKMIEAVKVMSSSLTLTSITLLTIITHQRYRTLAKGLRVKYEELNTEAIICIMFAWILGFLLGTGFLYVDAKVIGGMIGSHILFCLLYICFCYRRIMAFLKLREKELKTHSAGTGDTILMSHLLRREKRCLKAILLILLVLFATILPVLGVTGYSLYLRLNNEHGSKDLMQLWTWTTTTVYFNGAANPFIYAARYKKLGREMQQIIKRTVTTCFCCLFPNGGITSQNSSRRSSQQWTDSKSNRRKSSVDTLSIKLGSLSVQAI